MEHPDYANSAEKRLVTMSAMRQRPIYGTMELLPLCNMSCSMCYVRRNYEEVQALGGLKPVTYWIELGRQMQQAGVLFLLLTGGEPLLYPGFKELYLELQNLGMILTVNTNGTLLDETWVEFFYENMPRRINITLYGKDEKAYHDLCHYKEGFQKALKAIRLLKEYHIPVKINGSVTSVNRQDMEAIYQIGKELDVPVHMDTYMIPTVNGKKQDQFSKTRLTPEEAAKAELFTKKQELTEEMFTIYHEQMIDMVEHYDGSAPDGISCLAGNCSFAVDWQGNMRPCVSMTYPYVKVSETGFEKAWEQIAYEAKKLHMNQKCSACNFRPVCQICVASAYLETESYDGIPDYLCTCSREYYRLLKNQ